MTKPANKKPFKIRKCLKCDKKFESVDELRTCRFCRKSNFDIAKNKDISGINFVLYKITS